jgi:hypothetical protein
MQPPLDPEKKRHNYRAAEVNRCATSGPSTTTVISAKPARNGTDYINRYERCAPEESCTLRGRQLPTA